MNAVYKICHGPTYMKLSGPFLTVSTEFCIYFIERIASRFYCRMCSTIKTKCLFFEYSHTFYTHLSDFLLNSVFILRQRRHFRSMRLAAGASYVGSR